MLNLSRTQLRTAIWEMIGDDHPLRFRWLQEHPRTVEIVNQLVCDAMELSIQAHQARNASSPSGFFTILDDDEITSTVVEMVLGSAGLWAELDEQFPRTPPAVTSLDVMHDLLGDVAVVGASAPIRNTSHRAR